MPQEREDLRKIQRLQSMNIYPQLVRKLTERESARSVARWAMEQHVEGPAGAWGLGFWLKHLWVLRQTSLPRRSDCVVKSIDGGGRSHRFVQTRRPYSRK